MIKIAVQADILQTKQNVVSAAHKRYFKKATHQTRTITHVERRNEAQEYDVPGRARQSQPND